MLNNLKHFISFFLLIILVTKGFCAYASNNHLVIVYPRNGAIISATSTFFVGNTNPKATLTINGKPVKVYSNGAFVRVFNLQKGKNKIIMRSTLGSDVKVKNLEITVPITISQKTSSITEKPISINKDFIVNVDETPLRATPYGNRLTPVKKGVVFNANAILNKHYRIDLKEGRQAFIAQSAVKQCEKKSTKQPPLEKIYFTENSKDILIKIPVNIPGIVELNTDRNILTARLLGKSLEFKNYTIKSPYIKSFIFEQDTLKIELMADKFNGYDYFYEGNTFILKIRKPFNKGLRGKVIAIDAGHGGKEMGSIGPTEIPEKNINLNIARYLKEFLEAKGAIVIMTRENDDFIGLYERVKIAQQNDADVLISIHNNALPDGQNPYEIHGTSTYYYQKQALPLAQNIQKNLLVATGFQDHGIRHGSLVLTRPSLPVSILIEVGFMINPFEYEKLLNPINQKAYARAIGHGLEKYFEL